MIDVALCIATEHDPWLVALAVLVCCAGAFAIVQMFERARSASGLHRLGWAFLTSVAAGATIWCTHFVAMLAFEARVPVELDPILTIGSLVIAIVGSLIGFSIAGWRKGDFFPGLGGAIFGGAIAGMHFMGMAAYRVQGVVSWDQSYVVASVLCAAIFASGALIVLNSPRFGRYRIIAGIALIVTAIATLHFVAMTAMHITPFVNSETSLDASESWALALATALVGLVVIAGGVFAALIDRQIRSDAMRDLHHMATNDALTGLPNRIGFQTALAIQLHPACKLPGNVALFAIDLDRFKEINDLHGHKAGDEVLVQLARRMRATIGPNDTVARLGGDEFVAITRFEDQAGLTAFGDRLNAALRAPVTVGHFEARVGASIGVAVHPHDAGDAETLANNADLAMFRAKCENAPTPCYYDSELDQAVRDRRDLANDLRRAIEADELEVHYQLQASVTTREITGYEALLRWNHPERGAIPPATFIPIAEEHGLILQLGEWVLRKACADAMSWDHESKVAVNVSPLQLAHADLPRLIHEIMLATGLPSRRLEIELTESAIMADRARALHVLRQIKALGIGVALDDFGTGYSSLETLRAFPFDKIKLDRLFVSELEGSPQATAIIRAVLALGRSLSIPILAEGIETGDQLDVLIREGCDEVQGFLLGYPGPSPVTKSPASGSASRDATPLRDAA